MNKPMKTDLQTHDRRQPTAFDLFYAAPSPLGALNLAIADAVAAKQSDEFYRNLVAARDSLEASAALVAENKRLRDALKDAIREIKTQYVLRFRDADWETVGENNSVIISARAALENSNA